MRIRYAIVADAQAVVAEWNGIPETVEHISDSGNSVFLFRDTDDARRILRLTDPTFRTHDEVQAELNFLSHLKAQGVPVAGAIPNTHGSLTTDYRPPVTAHRPPPTPFICSVLEYAEGLDVREGSPYWNEAFFLAWGRNLALIHRAAQSFDPPPDVPRPWQWNEEILFRQAEQLFPRHDAASRSELEELMELCGGMERTAENFGIIHADHGPQNFHYDPVTQEITAFDFGNTCYHWFVCDVAIALSTVRKKKKREEIKRAILAGYTEIKPLPANLDEQLNVFLRLRALYVYLDRLYWFGDQPNVEQRKILASLRQRVHKGARW